MRSSTLLPLAVLANEWEDKDTIDRAHLFVGGAGWNADKIIWQNTVECYHCTWIRARDPHGEVIPPLVMNNTVDILVDVRWPQRFKLASKNDNDTTWQSLGDYSSDFFRFQENCNYSISGQSNETILIEKVAGHPPTYSPIWGMFLIFLGLQLAISGIEFLNLCLLSNLMRCLILCSATMS